MKIKRGHETTPNKLFGVNIRRGYKFPTLIGVKNHSIVAAELNFRPSETFWILLNLIYLEFSILSLNIFVFQFLTLLLLRVDSSREQ